MADKKISALTAATLPLAGTEVLPIVQSGSTVKVATDDLTVKNVRSNATSGLLQVAGPGAGTTRVMTTPNANFTAARTDAAQSFTGDQTLSTGNLIIGTSGKGIDFSAAGGDVLDYYDEGTWTPVVTPISGTLTAYTSSGTYVRVGKSVTLNCRIVITTNGTAANGFLVSGVPIAAATATMLSAGCREDTSAGFAVGASAAGAQQFYFTKYDNSHPGGNGYAFSFCIAYTAA